LSLPRIFGTTLASIPNRAPYLAADPVLKDVWHNLLPPGCDQLKVGLAWAGSATHTNDKRRSLALKQLAPLASATSVQFFSLQKGSAAQKAIEDAGPLNVLDFSDKLTDFADTAALIENLDLIITVDTAVAHLAGALGKPVWVLLPFVPDWRWLLDREDSPWYPTMRLFRQTNIGEWDAIIARVAECLAEFLNDPARRRYPK
jgi:hypothetical protein